MRYFVIALVILILGFAVAQAYAINVDEALAFADHSMLSISRWTGNPQFLVDARSKLHGCRYALAKPPEYLKLRIHREGDPPRVLPAPTLVVNPLVYQYGVAPGRMTAPLQGVLEPGTVLPPANVVPVTYVEDFEEKVPRNEVQDLPRGEREFEGRVNFDVARGWTGYVVWGEPTLDGEFTTRRSGEWSQKISGYATFRSGILRQFTAAPGTPYSLKVYGHLHILGGGAVHVGVDPTGGTNPTAESVVWFPQFTDLGRWMEMTASGESLAPTITVFLEGYSVLDDNTNSYFDDLELQVYREA